MFQAYPNVGAFDLVSFFWEVDPKSLGLSFPELSIVPIAEATVFSYSFLTDYFFIDFSLLIVRHFSLSVE